MKSSAYSIYNDIMVMIDRGNEIGEMDVFDGNGDWGDEACAVLTVVTGELIEEWVNGGQDRDDIGTLPSAYDWLSDRGVYRTGDSDMMIAARVRLLATEWDRMVDLGLVDEDTGDLTLYPWQGLHLLTDGEGWQGNSDISVDIEDYRRHNEMIGYCITTAECVDHCGDDVNSVADIRYYQPPSAMIDWTGFAAASERRRAELNADGYSPVVSDDA